MSKNVIITGGMGFIGHHLARHYLNIGFKVTIIDDLMYHESHPKLTKYRMEFLDDKRITFIQKNCSLTFSIKDQLKNSSNAPRSIIHLAGYPNQASVKVNEYNAISTMSSNTFAVTELCKFYGCRMVYVSSSMAYGNFTQTPQNENAELKPVNLYGLLKAQGEELVKLMHSNSVIVRPSAVYGPGDTKDRVLAKWISAALKDEDILVKDPSSLLDFTYVEDLVKGIAQAEEFGTAGHAYNLTYGQGRSLGEVSLLIKALTNSKSFIDYGDTVKDPNEPQRGALDIQKAYTHFGYRPRVDLISGVKSYIKWMQNYSHVY
jgi:nucleoside-diphosphate-sugar epimerase